jgi:hypothetical protein
VVAAYAARTIVNPLTAYSQFMGGTISAKVPTRKLKPSNWPGDAFLGAGGTEFRRVRCPHNQFGWEADMGRAFLLLLLGVPIPIIILLALVWH